MDEWQRREQLRTEDSSRLLFYGNNRTFFQGGLDDNLGFLKKLFSGKTRLFSVTTTNELGRGFMYFSKRRARTLIFASNQLLEQRQELSVVQRFGSKKNTRLNVFRGKTLVLV